MCPAWSCHYSRQGMYFRRLYPLQTNNWNETCSSSFSLLGIRKRLIQNKSWDCIYINTLKTAKQLLYNPRQTLRFSGGRGSQISRQYMKVLRLSGLNTDRVYPQEIFLVFIFCYRSSRSKDYSAAGRINSVTPPRIEHMTFRLLAQCLKQLHHCVPSIK
jgi:hypothetical protein